jgi:hypothetical protein
LKFQSFKGSNSNKTKRRFTPPVNYAFMTPSPWSRGALAQPALGSDSKTIAGLFRLANSLRPWHPPRKAKQISENRLKILGCSIGLVYPWNRLRPIEAILGRRLPRRVKNLSSYASMFSDKPPLGSRRFSRHFLLNSFAAKLTPQLFATSRLSKLQSFFGRLSYPFHRYGNGLGSEVYASLAHSFYRPFFRLGFISSWKYPSGFSSASTPFVSNSYFLASRTYKLSYLYLHRRFLNFKLLGEAFFQFNFPKPYKLGFEIWRRRRNLFASFVPPGGGGPFFRTTVGATGFRGPAKRSFEAPRQVAIRLYQWISKKFMRRYTRPNSSIPTLVFRIRSALTSRMRSTMFYFFRFIKTLARTRPRGRLTSLKNQPRFTFTSPGRFVFPVRRKIKTPLEKLLPKKSPFKNFRQERRQARLKAISSTFFRLSSPFPLIPRRRRSSLSAVRSNYYLNHHLLLKPPSSNLDTVSLFSYGLYIPRHSHGGLVRFSAARRRKNRRRLKTKRRLGFSNPLA